MLKSEYSLRTTQISWLYSASNFHKIYVFHPWYDVMPVCFIRLNMPVCFIRLQMNGISVLYHHVLMCHLDTFEFWIWMPFHCFIIDLLHKSHNAPVPYPTMHHFVTEICTCVQISVAKWCIVGNLSNALWDSWDGSIVGGPGGRFTSFFARNSNLMET